MATDAVVWPGTSNCFTLSHCCIPVHMLGVCNQAVSGDMGVTSACPLPLPPLRCPPPNTLVTAMQAHASKLAKDSEAPDNRFKGFDEFMASAKAHAAAKTEAEEPAGVETKTEAEDQPYSPSAGVVVEEDADLPDLVSLIGSSGVPGRNEVLACSLLGHRAGHMLSALPLLHCLCTLCPH